MVKKNILEGDFKFTNTAMIDLNHMYSRIVYLFKNVILDDLSDTIIFKYENTDTRIAFKERLMKSPKSLLTENKPILNIKTSIDTEFEGGMYTPLIFNTDMSHVLDVKKLADSFIITHDRKDNSKNMAISFMFNNIQLNIEPSIIRDSRPKLINIYKYWKTLRYPGRPYRRDIVMNLPLPRQAYLAYCDIWDLDPQDKIIAYKHIKKHSFYPITYNKNLSTGQKEIFLQYETYLDFTPGPSNMTDGVQQGNIRKDFTLTRSFKVNVNVPSICYVHLNRERYLMEMDEEEQDRLEELRDDMDEWYPYSAYNWMDYSDGEYEQICSSPYNFENKMENIDCKQLLYDQFDEFYQFIKEDDTLIVSEYIKIAYFKDEKRNEDTSFIIESDELIIKERNAELKASYKIALYVKLDYFNEWLENYRYEKY